MIRVELPDGSIAEFPAGTSPDQIKDALNRRFRPPVSEETLDPRDALAKRRPEPTAQQRFQASLPGRLLHGGLSTIDAAAQLLARQRPNNISPLLDDLFAKLPPASEVDRIAKNRAREYEQAKFATGFEGIDLAAPIGSVLLQIAATRGLPVPAATASLPSRLASGATYGAAYGGLQPVLEGNFGDEKLKQIATGAATGAVAVPATEAIARAIKPNVPEGIAALRKEGVFPTFGQVWGPRAKAVEERLTSVPFVGDVIRQAQRGADAQLNVAAWNRALEPLGLKLPKGMVGQEAANYVDDAISSAYRRAIDSMGAVKVDSKLLRDLYNLRDMLGNASKDAQLAFENFIRTQINQRLSQTSTLTAEHVKAIDEMAGNFSRELMRSGSAAERKLGAAYREAQASLREWLMRHKPESAELLRNADRAYANFLRPLRAQAMLGAQDEIFSPAQLHNAVRALDPSKHKKAFAKGEALMQDLSQPAKDAMGKRIPDSGTPERAMLAYLLANPLKGAAAAASAFPLSMIYSDPARKFAAHMSQRPDFADPLAGYIRQTSPVVGAAMYGLLGGQ